MNKKEISEAARTLARLGKGVPKRFTKAELARRTQRLAEARKKRWAKEKTQ
jgi:hypothetical protein